MSVVPAGVLLEAVGCNDVLQFTLKGVKHFLCNLLRSIQLLGFDLLFELCNGSLETIDSCLEAHGRLLGHVTSQKPDESAVDGLVAKKFLHP
jgi:hypothetical protein